MQNSNFGGAFQRFIASVLVALALMLVYKTVHAQQYNAFPAGTKVWYSNANIPRFFSSAQLACKDHVSQNGGTGGTLGTEYFSPYYGFNQWECFITYPNGHSTYDVVDEYTSNGTLVSSDTQTTANDAHANCGCDLQDGGD